MIHVVLILFGKVIIDTLPGMTQQMSWSLVNLVYLAVRAVFFTKGLLLTPYQSSLTSCSTG